MAPADNRTPWKWGLCILLFLATTLNYLDRQVMAILAPVLQKEMHLGNESLGWLFSVFYYSYTFSQFGVGFLLDRSNLRWTYGLAVIAWSAVAALTGLSSGFTLLLIFRLLLGIAESANWPGALRIVQRSLPPGERALGSGIFTSGTSIGALIAPSLVLGITAAFGWRWAFAGVGSLGLLWFAAWVLFTRRAGMSDVWISRGEPGENPSRNGSGVVRTLFRDPQFWKVWLVAILVNPCLYFSVNWLPTYFAQQRGLAPGRQLGIVLTAIYVGLDLGYLTCGAGVLWLTRRGRSLPNAQRVVFTSATCLISLCAAVPWIQGLTEAVAVLVIVNFGLGMWIATYLTFAQEVSHTNLSTAAGLLGGSGSLVGALAMWAVGRVTQRTASFTIPMLSVVAAVILAAVAGWHASRPAARREQEVAV